MPDSRDYEAVALVVALAADPRARKPDPRLQPLLAEALAKLAVGPASPEADEAIGDVAAAFSAYLRAREDEQVRAADVRRLLAKKVLPHLEHVQEMLAEGAVGRQARLHLEDALFELSLAELPPPGPGQLAQANQRVGLANLRLLARRRRGQTAAAEAMRRPRIDLPDVLLDSEAEGPLFHRARVLDAAHRAEAMGQADQNPVSRLQAAIQYILDTLPANGASRAFVTPPASVVLAWACVELVEAWRPTGAPASMHDNGAACELAAVLHRAAEPDAKPNIHRERIVDALSLRDEGQVAVAFAGRYPRERRIKDVEDAWHARTAAS